MRAVNLLPRDDARRERRRQVNPPALVAVAGVVVLSTMLAAGFLLSSAKVADNRQTLGQLEQELDALPPPPVQSGADATLVEEKKRRVAALGSALSQRIAWDRVLRELSLVLPGDVWLSTLNAKSPVTVAAPPGQAAGAAPSGFTITGYTYSQDAVARLLTRLAVVPHLTNVQLQNSSRTDFAGRSIVQFTILADLRPPGASS